MKISLLALAFFCFHAHAGLNKIADRPLRTLNTGSEVYISVFGDLRENYTYQDGKSSIGQLPPFDDKKPFCRVEEYSALPDMEQRNIALELGTIEGGVYDSRLPDDWTKFITQIHFFNRTGADLSLTCYSDSSGSFKEITIGEFEQVFGIHLRFGKLSLSDSGIEIRNPLYGEYDVLTADVLEKFIQLIVEEPITLAKPQDQVGLEVVFVNGKVVKDHDFSQPYCKLIYDDQEKPVELPDEVTLPKGLILKTNGAVSGSYNKSSDLTHGFTTMVDLSGYKLPLKLFCNSNDPHKPLRYSDARKITHPALDWAYTF